MALVYTIILMALSMKATGAKISNMEMAKNPGQTALYMKENILPVRNMASVSINGMMVLNIMENGLKIK